MLTTFVYKRGEWGIVIVRQRRKVDGMYCYMYTITNDFLPMRSGTVIASKKEPVLKALLEEQKLSPYGWHVADRNGVFHPCALQYL